MRAIMVMYDSLNRKMLEPYGCDWCHTPNFKRLAEKSVQFENNYVGSMPCMSARRELHTGRLNFFHRSWGPLEPFDDSMPEILKKGGIYTHLVATTNIIGKMAALLTTDGIPHGKFPAVRRAIHGRLIWALNAVWEPFLKQSSRIIKRNHSQDNWFLQIETFDPHEPFYTLPADIPYAANIPGIYTHLPNENAGKRCAELLMDQLEKEPAESCKNES